MRGEVALVREQGQTFAVLAVRDSVLHSPEEREKMARFGEQQFGVRTALLGADRGGTWGPRDIVRWLESVHLRQLPWRSFSVD